MWHWYHVPDDKQVAPRILSAIDHIFHVPIFPNLKTCWHYDEKLSQHYLLDALRVPRVKTWVFWDYDQALAFLERAQYPIIFKLSVGAGSANVLRLESTDQARQKIDQIFGEGILPYTFDAPPASDGSPSPWYYLKQHNYAYFQEFLANNSHDIRVTVIGDRALGFLRQNREGDFRASGSGRLDHDPQKIPREALEIAFEVSQKCGFQCMAYDFLRDAEGKVRLNELSYCFINRSVYECPGFWESRLEFHPGHHWPEEFQVEDFLRSVSLS
jgi:glutathione synthase/RimK-type ligase-like ATP-grasp enzyme